MKCLTVENKCLKIFYHATTVVHRDTWRDISEYEVIYFKINYCSSEVVLGFAMFLKGFGVYL